MLINTTHKPGTNKALSLHFFFHNTPFASDFLQELYLTFDGTALKWYLVGVGLPDGIPPSTKFLAYKKERTEKSL